MKVDAYSVIPMKLGVYIDLKLIHYVGGDAYEAWSKGKPDTTVYDFMDDFDISPEKLKEIVHDSIYEEYMMYYPKFRPEAARSLLESGSPAFW